MEKQNNSAGLDAPYWEATDLIDMSKDQWEALCDRCGKCCLLKLEDEDTGIIHYTNVVCHLFNEKTCSCGNYPMRKELVPGCVVLTTKNIEEIAHWMPSTCAYRLLHQGNPLPDWHPLITGDQDTVRAADISVHDKVIFETEVAEEDLEDYVIQDLQ